MIANIPELVVIALFWFPIYWIFGGVMFAGIAFMRMMKLRKARFSCLFTLASVGAAVGASYAGLWYADGRIAECTQGSHAFLDVISSAIGCGTFELVGAGVLGYVALSLVSGLLLILSRADNQSWMDSHMGLEKEDRLTFEG